jgi:hypothetical protein
LFVLLRWPIGRCDNVGETISSHTPHKLAILLWIAAWMQLVAKIAIFASSASTRIEHVEVAL